MKIKERLNSLILPLLSIIFVIGMARFSSALVPCGAVVDSNLSLKSIALNADFLTEFLTNHLNFIMNKDKMQRLMKGSFGSKGDNVISISSQNPSYTTIPVSQTLPTIQDNYHKNAFANDGIIRDDADSKAKQLEDQEADYSISKMTAQSSLQAWKSVAQTLAVTNTLTATKLRQEASDELSFNSAY